MNKKQYFMILWGVPSFIIIAYGILFLFTGNLPIHNSGPEPIALRTSTSFMLLIIGMLLTLLLKAITVSIGIDFAQKINAKLLFLNGNFDFKRDIFKPAILGAIAYGIFCLLITKVSLSAGIQIDQFPAQEGQFPDAMFFSTQHITAYTLLFYISGCIINIISNNVWSLLVITSGIALLLRSIINDISTSEAILWGVILRSCYLFLVAMGSYGFSLFIIPVVPIIKNLLLGLIFWKKGFEAVLLCNLIIVAFLYMFAPLLVLSFAL